MKRILYITLIMLMLPSVFCVPAAAEASGGVSAADIISQAAVLMDGDTGQVLFQKSAESLMYPASTTKIVTALLAAERGDMDGIAEVTQSAVELGVWNSSNIALTEGERLPLDSLMYGLMLPSGNDAANVIAEHIAGSQRDFARLMTERALAAGAKKTKFQNAHGLHEPGHYTTALDLANITRDAIKNRLFLKYFGADLHTIPPTNKQPEERPFTNYQYMLVETTDHYDPRVIGGKVGYTDEARHTMSTAAVSEGRTLICVVMNSPGRGDKFADTKLLLDYGFNGFKKITIPREELGFEAEVQRDGKKTAAVSFSAAGDFTALLPNAVSEGAVQLKRSHEGPFGENEPLEAYVELTVAQNSPAFPANLGRLELEARLTELVPAISASPAPQEESRNDWLIPGAVISAALGGAAALFVYRRVQISRRRKRRLARLARLQREVAIRK